MTVLTRRYPRSALIGLIGMPLLLLCCLVYYRAFGADLDLYFPDRGTLQYALNSHDHFVYVTGIDRVREGFLAYEVSNDLGIAMIYAGLAAVAPWLVTPDFTLLSFVFNCVTLCAVYLVYARICNDLALSPWAKAAFFANLSLVYFAQLINKDMLTVLAFLLAVAVAIRGRLFWLVLLLPALALVRQQLAVFAVLFVLLMRSRHPVRLIVLMYVGTSVLAGVLSIFAGIIGDESLGDGFSLYLIDFNRRYYIGYLLFNPVRVAQYVLDALRSFDLSTETGGIDTAKLLRWPQLLLLFVLGAPMASLLTRFRHWLGTPARPLVLTVVAYLLAWLMNPTVNARYVMLITPVLVLFAFYVRAAGVTRQR